VRCKKALKHATLGPNQSESAPEARDGYDDQNFRVEFETFSVAYQGEEILLTHKEFDVFRALLERPGKVLTREKLLQRVWGSETNVDPRSIDAIIRRLRAKLGRGRVHVETLVGIGYRFLK